MFLAKNITPKRSLFLKINEYPDYKSILANDDIPLALVNKFQLDLSLIIY
jgi:hypothetical protein